MKRYLLSFFEICVGEKRKIIFECFLLFECIILLREIWVYEVKLDFFDSV